MNPRRAVVLCEFATLNGGENSLLAAVPHLGESGFELIAASPPEGPLADAFRGCGVEIAPFEVRPGGERRPNPELREELAALLRRIAPNLLHANSLAMGRLSGPVAEELAEPSIAHLRDMIRLSGRAVADLNRHRLLLAVSKATRDWHVAQGIDAGRMHVLHNGVDLERFRPQQRTGSLHRELGLPPATKLVGSIGQIGMRKGLDVLLAAAKSVVKSLTDVHFVIIGERHSEKEEAIEFERSLHRVAAESPLTGRVHFLGRRDVLEFLLPELDLLAHAARQEPLGRVLLEAAASGVAVVATDVGGTREIFGDPPAALLVPPDDAAALAEAMNQLLKYPEERARLVAEARRRAEANFDATMSGERLARHYMEIID